MVGPPRGGRRQGEGLIRRLSRRPPRRLHPPFLSRPDRRHARRALRRAEAPRPASSRHGKPRGAAALGAIARRCFLPASLRRARLRRADLGGAARAWGRRAASLAGACPAVNGLFGLGQTLLLALPPEQAHELAIKGLELGLYPRAHQPDEQRLG